MPDPSDQAAWRAVLGVVLGGRFDDAGFITIAAIPLDGGITQAFTVPG